MLVVTFGVLVLGDPISATSGFGVCIAIGGGLWYAQERKRLDEATRRGGGGGDNAKPRRRVRGNPNPTTLTLTLTLTR